MSWSGGLDSTVLLDLARRIDPNIPAVFCNTGLEHPDNLEFVKAGENVIKLPPTKNFLEILNTYGYPVISKDVADVIDGARRGQKQRLQRINGEMKDHFGKKSKFNCEKYNYLMDADFLISGRCCEYLKTNPIKKYAKSTGRKGLTGTLTEESYMRTKLWLQSGCNNFDAKLPLSRPMSFWTRQDILEYIVKFHLPYSRAYGEITPKENQQLSLISPKLMLETTGEQRTGYMFY